MVGVILWHGGRWVVLFVCCAVQSFWAFKRSLRCSSIGGVHRWTWPAASWGSHTSFGSGWDEQTLEGTLIPQWSWCQGGLAAHSVTAPSGRPQLSPHLAPPPHLNTILEVAFSAWSLPALVFSLPFEVPNSLSGLQVWEFQRIYSAICWLGGSLWFEKWGLELKLGYFRVLTANMVKWCAQEAGTHSPVLPTPQVGATVTSNRSTGGARRCSLWSCSGLPLIQKSS